MKGDRVEIVVDAGEVTKTYEVVASRAGRRVEVVSRRGLVEVSEITRGGTPIRTARFMASRVIAVVEHPATTERGISRPRAMGSGAPGSRRQAPARRAPAPGPRRRIPAADASGTAGQAGTAGTWPEQAPGSG